MKTYSLEFRSPVESTTTSGGRASVVHVVHTVLTDEGEKRLSGLLDSLVESLRRRVTVLTENLVLSKEHSLYGTERRDSVHKSNTAETRESGLTDTSHKDTTFTVEIRVNFLLEGGLVSVTGTDSDSESTSLLHRLSGNVLPNSDRGVDTATLLEESSDSSSRSLGSAEDYVDVLGSFDTSVLGVNEGETVREVESLALSLFAILREGIDQSSIPSRGD